MMSNMPSIWSLSLRLSGMSAAVNSLVPAPSFMFLFTVHFVPMFVSESMNILFSFVLLCSLNSA